MINKSRSHQDKNGFTIVELIVGIALIGIVIVVITAMIQILIQMNDAAHDTTLVTSSAQNKIESLRSSGFNAIGSDGTEVDFSNELSSSIPTPRSAKYTITVNSARPAEKNVVVDIEADGKHYIYKTVIGELGVGQY